MRFYTNIVPWGNSLLLREVVNGERVARKIKYSPTLYCPVMRETKFQTLDGKYVTPVKHQTIKEAKEWVEAYKNQPHLVYGNTQFQYSFLNEEYNTDFDKDQILITTIDIEVACENGFPNPDVAEEEMLSITLKNQSNKEIIVFGLHEYKTNRKDVTYIKCNSEKDLLYDFLNFWCSNYPDIITGWNTEFFDIPYLVNRIKKVLGEDDAKRLSPWKSVHSKDVYQMGRTQMVYDIQGIAALDYFDLYRKFTYTNQESYRLDHIASVELGVKKDENPHDTFRDWYTNDYQSFIDYNIKDVEIVDALEDKMKLIELCLTMAYEAKVNYTDVLGSVKYWDILIHNYLMSKGVVIPQKKSSSKDSKYMGAYVKDPQVGMHKWVLSFDLNSLYPHLIMQYNISPETMKSEQTVPGMTIDKLLNQEVDTSPLGDNVTMTPNGALFNTKKQGFLPEIMQTMYNDRVKYKRYMLDAKQQYVNTKDPKFVKQISKFNNIQMAKKISLNSAYGAIGNNWFRYYSNTMAEAITSSGQLSIRWIEKKINEFMNDLLKTKDKDYVIASDTDSVYITFDTLVEKFQPKNPVDFLDTIAKEKIEPFIDTSYKELAEFLNAYDQKMQMKREVIADKGIWTAKKRYILNAWDVEGVRYKEPELKIMGIEAVKSSTPAACRDKIKEALHILMSGTEKEMNTFIQTFREEFMNLPPELVAYPRSVNGLSKWTESHSLFKKGAPIHVKGAILYNHLIEKNKLQSRYPYIQEGDKIKFLYMKLPNIYQSSSIAFMTKLPKQLNFAIDYELQFEKSFVEPLNYIIEKINWNVDRSYGTAGNLEDFFV